jgi:tetratricopeptide (TPR) repeat protein
MGIGAGLSAFADSYLKAQQAKSLEDRNELQFALQGRAIKGEQQEQQDLASLAQLYQQRRQAGAPDALAGGGVTTSATLGPGGPVAAGGKMVSDAGDLAGAGVTSPGVAGAPLMPGPALPAAPRRALLDELDPGAAGRILSRPTSRAAFKDLETAEREQEQFENRKKADDVFKEANAAIKSGDALGFYDHVSRGMRILGRHDEASRYLEHSLNLRQDKDELDRSNADLKGWMTANATYTADPSPENYQAFLESLSNVNSKAGRALRQQILGNVVSKTFDQNPQVTAFNRSVAKGYMDAFEAGKPADAEKIFKEAAAANPQGFNSYIFGAMSNQRAIPEVVLKKVLRWDVADAKEIPKDVWSFAFARTQAMMPGVRPDDPRFMEKWNQELVRVQKQMTESKTKDDSDKDLRSDLDGARKRLGDVRTQLRQKDLKEEDPARYQDLLEEERQAKADLQGLEGKARTKGTLGPEVKPEAPKAQPGPSLPKADDDGGVKRYKNAARMEYDRLRKVGLDARAAVEAMKRGGWSVE